MEGLRNILFIFLSIVCLKPEAGESVNSPMVNLVTAALSQYADYARLNSKGLDTRGNNTLIEGKEDNPETRGGHGGGGGYGHSSGHGHGYGAITLDPVSIISLLALGAFLINNILQLLRANAPAPAPAPVGRKRSFGSLIPDSIFPTLLDMEQNAERTGSGEPNFGKFFENVGSLYYLQPKKRNLCIKKVVCGYLSVQKSREDNSQGSGNFKTNVFDFMLSTISRLVVPELSSQSQVKEDVCKKFNKLCSDSLLQDAKISVKNKVYHEMSNLISALTVGGVSQLMG